MTNATARRRAGAWLASLAIGAAVVCRSTLGASFAAQPPSSAFSGIDTPDKSPASCLRCHGPFAKLAEKTAAKNAPSGETTTPHRHIPHDTLLESTVPDCESCHSKHPIPATKEGMAAVAKSTWDFCYNQCHHQKDFTPCKTCHTRG
jgi:hypothetical protein